MLCVTCGGENGISGHLAVFSDDIGFACHFMGACLALTLSYYRSASGMATPVKNHLVKLVGNLASYPVYSRHSDLP